MALRLQGRWWLVLQTMRFVAYKEAFLLAWLRSKTMVLPAVAFFWWGGILRCH